VATQKLLSEPYPMKAKGYGFFSETPIAQANNLKVTIGAAELVSRTIPEAKRSGIRDSHCFYCPDFSKTKNIKFI
jgi:hypothetical protein